MNNTSIGIIGGMGPQASALLHTLIVNAVPKELNVQECDRFPLITHVSIPAVDFISQPELRHKNRTLVLNAVKAINSTQPDFVIMACNTAHLLIDEIPELQALPLLSLPDTAVQLAAKSGIQNLGLLASPTTVKTGLYHKAANKHGMTVTTLASRSAPLTETIIRDIIAGASPDDVVGNMSTLIDELRAAGAEAVLLGCTELSVAAQGLARKDTIDPLHAVVAELMQRIRSQKKEESDEQ